MNSPQPGLHIFQIYYSAETRGLLDESYIPLDNTPNARPDWREYWPIRNYFLNNPPVAGDYYGFLSPAFGAKTGLSSRAVRDFVNAHLGKADVILFSPFFDQIAFFLNQGEQGVGAHKAAAPPFEQSLAAIAPGFRLSETVGCSRNTVFCNYFIATGVFWSEWLARCELVFDCAERGDTPLGRALAAPIDYNSQAAPMKVFIIERAASALLATQPRWSVKAYNSMLLPLSRSPISALGPQLAALDALKIAYLSERYEQYKLAFFKLRAQVLELARKPR
jgi:hypothetical protein